MDTKHINVPLDTTTVTAKESTLQPGAQRLAEKWKGTSGSRLVAEVAVAADVDADSAEDAAAAPELNAANARPPRTERVIHRTAGRLMHKNRGRR